MTVKPGRVERVVVCPVPDIAIHLEIRLEIFQADTVEKRYRPLVPGHAGTIEDPIPWVSGMDVDEGKYYSFSRKTYLAKADMKPCVWTPGTPGLWQWEEVTNVQSE